MPAALAFVPVAIGAAGAGGLAAFAATTAGMFSIAGAALGAIGGLTGNKGLATIGTLVSLGSSVAGMAGAGADAAGATAADTASGALTAEGGASQAAQAIVEGADPATQAVSETAANAAEQFGPGGAPQSVAEAAKAGPSMAERAISSPNASWQGTTDAGTFQGGVNAQTTQAPSGGLISGVMDWAKQNPILSSGLIKTGGEFIAKGFARNPQAEMVDLNREKLALEQRLAEIQLANKSSAAGVRVGVNANTAANLYPNGAYTAPGGGFIRRAMT